MQIITSISKETSNKVNRQKIRVNRIQNDPKNKLIPG